jgi:hypothetical protein
MSVQPISHDSITPMGQPAFPAAEKKPKRAAKKPSARAEAVRIAKAKISRRDSLRKQRQALKD